jgi:hypothetical protein
MFSAQTTDEEKGNQQFEQVVVEGAQELRAVEPVEAGWYRVSRIHARSSAPAVGSSKSTCETLHMTERCRVFRWKESRKRLFTLRGY